MTLTSTTQKFQYFAPKKEKYNLPSSPQPKKRRNRVKFEDLVLKPNSVIDLRDDFSFDDHR